MTILQWNEEDKVLVDQQGIMLSRGSVLALKKKIEAHLKHSASELRALGRASVEENHPNMVNQFNWEYFD